MASYPIRWIQNRRRNYHTVLYIGRPSSKLATHLYHALTHRGALSISLHPDSKLISPCTRYDCYVLDADFIGDVSHTMHRILGAHPDARILVVSDRYDWRDSVNAFQQGAIDVIRQPNTAILTYEILKVVFKQQLPRKQWRNAGV